jgi:PLP dependent protein
MIAAHLADVRARIAAAADACGRNPTDIELVAVSKTRPLADIVAAFDAGQVHFGENYVQELSEKRGAFALQRPTLPVWHFTGRVQSGNAKAIASYADVVHGVGSLSQARALSHAAVSLKRNLVVYVQLNVPFEPQKNGFALDDALAQVEALSAFPSLQIAGVMAMPTSGDFAAVVAAQRALPWRGLSLGMSDDYERAIGFGSTCVRVGTAIFGARS